MASEKTEALLVTDRRSFQYLKIVLREHEVVWKSFMQLMYYVNECYVGPGERPAYRLIGEKRQEAFRLRKELTCVTNQQVIARAKEIIHIIPEFLPG